MKKFFNKIIVLSCFIFAPLYVMADDISGTASVNVTSDTATTAKAMAMAEARRQILSDILPSFSDRTQVINLIKNSKDSDLTDLFSSVNIDSERQSATTYSANIKMTIDAVAAKKWLDNNNVSNWFDRSVSNDKFSASIEISDGMRDWIGINRDLRGASVSYDVAKISGKTVILNVSSSNKSLFIATLRNSGWRVSNSDFGLYISK